MKRTIGQYTWILVKNFSGMIGWYCATLPISNPLFFIEATEKEQQEYHDSITHLPSAKP